MRVVDKPPFIHLYPLVSSNISTMSMKLCTAQHNCPLTVNLKANRLPNSKPYTIVRVLYFLMGVCACVCVKLMLLRYTRDNMKFIVYVNDGHTYTNTYIHILMAC